MSNPNMRLDEIGYQGMNLRHEWSHNRICTTAEAPGQYEHWYGIAWKNRSTSSFFHQYLVNWHALGRAK
jgi:hypothetical protein